MAGLAGEAAYAVCIQGTHGGAGVVHTPVAVAVAVGGARYAIGQHTCAKLRLTHWNPTGLSTGVGWPAITDFARRAVCIGAAVTEAGTIAGIAYAAICGAVTHFVAVVAACTAAQAGIAFIARRAAFSGTCVGNRVAGDAVVYIKHFVDGCIGRGGHPCAVAGFTTVAVAVGTARAHAFGFTHAVKRLASRVGRRAACAWLQVKRLSWEG